MRSMQQLDELTKDSWLRALLNRRSRGLGVQQIDKRMKMLVRKAVNSTTVSTKVGCTVLMDGEVIMICAMKMETC